MRVFENTWTKATNNYDKDGRLTMMPKGDLANGPSELEGDVQEAYSSPSDALDTLKHLTSTSTNELYTNGAYLSDKAASNDFHNNNNNNNDVTMSDSTSNYDNGSLVDECNYQHISGKFVVIT